MKKGIFFSCLLSLALCGCGGANQNANENPSQTNGETSQTVEQEKPVTMLEPVYVLSDQFGEKFLLQTAFEGNVAPATPDDLNRYKYIVYNDRYYPVQLKGAQLENEAENNYRDTYYKADAKVPIKTTKTEQAFINMLALLGWNHQYSDCY